MSCHVVVLPASVQPHLGYCHKAAGIHIDRAHLEEIIIQEDLTRDWPEVPTSILPSFAQLQTALGYQCPSCPYMASKPKQINKHSINDHKKSTQHLNLPKRWMQRYSQFHEAKQWFQVYPVDAAAFVPPLQYLVDLREQLDERPALLADQVDVRHVDPWLITTGWQSYANLYPTYIQPQLLDLSQDDQHHEEFRLVKKFVYQYLQGPYDQLAQTPEICRQVLNTDSLTGYV